MHEILDSDKDNLFSLSDVAKVSLIFACDLVAESKKEDFHLGDTGTQSLYFVFMLTAILSYFSRVLRRGLDLMPLNS